MDLSLWVMAVASFIAAILSGLGLGSAGIFVLFLTMVAGYGQTEAQGMNLLFYLISAGISLLLHIRKRNIPWKLVRLLVICALMGTLLGTYLVNVLNVTLVRRLFGGMLIISGIPSLFEKKQKPFSKKNK